MRDKKKIVAPPVYRPQPPPRVLQTKRPAVQQPVTPKTRGAVAPPIYRPQPVPKVLQTKTIAQLTPGPRPAHSRVVPKVLQRKKVVQRGTTSNSRPVIQRAMEDSVEQAHEAITEEMRQAVRDMREQLPVNFVKAEGDAPITHKNTNFASGVLTWSGKGTPYKPFASVPSGNPKHKHAKVKIWLGSIKSGVQIVKVPRRFHEKGDIGSWEHDVGAHGNCAEQKILLQARPYVNNMKQWIDEDTAPMLTIISEKTPCSVCEAKILEFRKDFPYVAILIEAGERYVGEHPSTWWYGNVNGKLKLGFPATAKFPLIGGKSGKPDPKNEKKDSSTNPFAGLMDEE